LAIGHGVQNTDINAEIIIFDILQSDFNEKIRLSFHDKGVSHVAFSPDSKFLISIGTYEEQSVVVWDISSGTVVGQCGNNGAINDITVFSGQELMFATCGSNSLRLWKVEEGELLFFDIPLPEENLILTALEYTPYLNAPYNANLVLVGDT